MMSLKVQSTLVWLSLAFMVGCQSEETDTYLKLADMELSSADDGVSCKMSWEPKSGWDDRSVMGGGGGKGDPFDDVDPPHETMPGVSSKRAARLWSVGALDTRPGPDPASCDSDVSGRRWGANLSVGPKPDSGTPGCPQVTSDTTFETRMDLSKCSGLIFWAKAKTDSMENRIRVMLPDRFSDPRRKQCRASNCIGDTRFKCWNPYSTTFYLTDSFVRYEVDFSTMWRDSSWGQPPDPYGPALAEVYSIDFQVDAAKCAADPNAACAQEYPPLAFDFWIDDIYLVNCRQ
jgi:hypothetical protein